MIADGIAHLILHMLHTRPAAEDEGVVGGEDGDNIDALALELVDVGNVGWEVVGVAGGLGTRYTRQGRPDYLRFGRRLTVKAPGTAKITTFLPFQASVVNLVAIGDYQHTRMMCRKWREILTNTARKPILELRGVRDCGELALGDSVSDLDADHFD